MPQARFPYDDRKLFAERFRPERPDTLTHAARVMACRGPMLPIFDPPPPDTLHLSPAAPPGGHTSAGIQPPPSASTCNGSLPISVDPSVPASVGGSGVMPASGGH